MLSSWNVFGLKHRLGPITGIVFISISPFHFRFVVREKSVWGKDSHVLEKASELQVVVAAHVHTNGGFLTVRSIQIYNWIGRILNEFLNGLP